MIDVLFAEHPNHPFGPDPECSECNPALVPPAPEKKTPKVFARMPDALCPHGITAEVCPCGAVNCRHPGALKHACATTTSEVTRGS